jgi:DNA polymerase I-like protein with 3'-5' exonuclease and polymerase domains
MTIHYITHKEPKWEHPDIKPTDSLDRLVEMFKNTDIIGADSENTSVHPINARPLLFQFSDGKESYVVDTTTCSTSFLKALNPEKKQYLMHNGQYDYMIAKYHYGVELRNINDTMQNEQILGRGSGRSASLENTHLRRLSVPMPVPKATRNDFMSMGVNPEFELDHILYSGYDPQCLFPIFEAQKLLIEQYSLQRRVYDIAHPCIPILGDMCLNGFYIDNIKWNQILAENKTKKFEVELKLDTIIRDFSKYHKEIRGGKWTNIRKKQDLLQTDMFGGAIGISNDNKNNISYSSNKQLAYFFKVLREPLPQKADKNSKDWNNRLKDSFAEEALEQYKIQYPSSILTPFINHLIEYRGYEKAINSFGEVFLKEYIKKSNSKKYKLGYFNSKTQKVHTIYKQEFTKNGRLSSGDVRHGFFNSQQIIKDNKYRNSFTLSSQEIADGWLISTYDLSSAELVILASQSGDKKLIELIKKKADLHSYLASAIYTKIFKYIIENMAETRAIDEISHLLEVNRLQHDYECEYEENGKKKNRNWTNEELKEIQRKRVEDIFANNGKITVNKKTYPDLRNPVKNIVYGISYGAAGDKVAETLNIAIHYANLAMEAMEEELPDAFTYLKRISQFGIRNGYIVFNERTNSRHWFQSWLEAKEQGRELTGKEKGAIGRGCKNYCISGTQADMIKETMVEVNKYVLTNNIEFEWLMQVHDEIVFKHKNSDLGKTIKQIIVSICNKYLKDIEMDVEGFTGLYWNK